MKLSDIISAIFPLRTVLLAEIEYLKSQLAQERRRVDVLQEGLIQAKKPSVFLPSARINPAGKPKPIGWEATRAEIRSTWEAEKYESAKIVSPIIDAGSESEAVAIGIMQANAAS